MELGFLKVLDMFYINYLKMKMNTSPSTVLCYGNCQVHALMYKKID